MSDTLRRDRIDLPGGSILIGLCLIWGMNQVMIKLALHESIPPFLQAGLRSTGSLILLMAWVRLRGGRGALGRMFMADATLWPGLLTAALFAGEFLFMYPGLLLTTASRATLFVYTAPFWVAAGVHLLVPGERLTPRQGFGLILAFIGVGFAMGDGLMAGGGQWLGDLFCLLAGAFWGLTTVSVRASRPLMAVRPEKVLLYQLGGSAPVLLLAGLIAGEAPILAHGSALGWGWLGYQVLVIAFFSYLTWYWLIGRYPAGRLAAFTFLVPVFGLAAGWLVLGEPVSALLVVALVLVTLGIQLVNGPSKAK